MKTLHETCTLTNTHSGNHRASTHTHKQMILCAIDLCVEVAWRRSTSRNDAIVVDLGDRLDVRRVVSP